MTIEFELQEQQQQKEQSVKPSKGSGVLSFIAEYWRGGTASSPQTESAVVTAVIVDPEDVIVDTQDTDDNNS